jgi:hypothetical protein
MTGYLRKTRENGEPYCWGEYFLGEAHGYVDWPAGFTKGYWWKNKMHGLTKSVKKPVRYSLFENDKFVLEFNAEQIK